MTAIVLAGHGSHLSAEASRPVHAHAARLRARGRYATVACAFWKEEPALSRVFDGLPGGDITVIPVLMADGYFTREVIPAEMGLSSRVTVRDGRRIRYTAPVGTHPALAAVVVERAREAAAGAPVETLVVLAHGTSRSATSAGAAEAQADRVRATGTFPRVVTLFLDGEDGEPPVEALGAVAQAGRTVVVPFFLGDGWHAGTSLPEIVTRAGGTIACAGAVGTHPAVAGVIEQLIEEAAAW